MKHQVTYEYDPQDNQIMMAERDCEYRMLWDELRYGAFSSAMQHAEAYAHLAARVAYEFEGEE